MLPALKIDYTVRKALGTCKLLSFLPRPCSALVRSQMAREEMGLQPTVAYVWLGPHLCSPGCFWAALIFQDPEQILPI